MQRRGKRSSAETAPGPALPRFVRVAELCAKLGVTRQGLHRMRKRGDLPEAVQLAPNTIGWAEDVLVRHFATRPAAR